MSARIRRMLDLSTAHLPEHLGQSLHTADGVSAYRMIYGFLMWVPDDPQKTAEAEIDGVPPEVLAVQLHARRLDCDYVLFDAGGDVDPDLPTWDWEN